MPSLLFAPSEHLATVRSPLDALAAELGEVAGRIERESALRIDALVADLRRGEAERELRWSRLERAFEEKIAAIKDGPPGPAGPQGERGIAGERGEKGDLGPAGPRGDVGPQGERGADGAPGSMGPQGEPGERGEVGPQGPPGEKGEAGTLGDRGEPGIPGERGEPGIPGERGEAGIPGERGEAGPAGPPGEDGAIGPVGPAGPPGKDGAIGPAGPAGEAGVAGERGDIGPQGPPGERGERGESGPAGNDGMDGHPGPPGERGADGHLPKADAWVDGVHYENAVVTHKGGTYQALRDTGREPPHEDWICLAAPGRNGSDGRSFTVRGTYTDGGDYSALDVVALDGSTFVARRDDPGPCPGEGWQLMSPRGKPGKPGEPGRVVKGDPGPPGPGLRAIEIDDNGLLVAINADGSTVTCDLYPLLARLG